MTCLQLLNESAMMGHKTEGCTMNTFLNGHNTQAGSVRGKYPILPANSPTGCHSKLRSNAKNPKFFNESAFAILVSSYHHSYRKSVPAASSRLAILCNN